MNQKTKKIQTTKSGFTLVESLIAIFIFSLAATMLSGSFSGFLKTYVDAKKTQRSTESSQYTMNLMAKTIRSSVIDPAFANGTSIMLFDNSRSTCVVYKYESGVLKSATTSGPTVTNINSCVSAPPSSFFDLSGAGEITGVNFVGSAPAAGSFGKVTITMAVQDGSSSQLQTTVSLRNSAGATAGASPPVIPPSFVCTGIPTNAGLCAGDDTGLPANTSSTVVAACGAPKCEYTCNAGYMKSGNTCVLIPTYICTNIPTHAAICAGDDTGLPANTSSTVVAACGAPKCEYTCDSGYTKSGNVCVASAAPCPTATAPSYNGVSCVGTHALSVTLPDSCIFSHEWANGDWTKEDYKCVNGSWVLVGTQMDFDSNVFDFWSDSCGNSSSVGYDC